MNLSIPVNKKNPSLIEFIVLVSAMMSLTALSIDAMLPALPDIGTDLAVIDSSNWALIISLIFIGLGVGQLFFGPLSDSIGRKPTIYLGMGVFVVGAVLSLVSTNFTMMLIGRFLQGIGVSAPRAVTLALVRDQFSGREMARIMSFVMTVFILMPLVAPSIGQAILLVAGWRAIFAAFVLFAILTTSWFALRQPETLATKDRIPFEIGRIVSGAREVLTTRIAFGYMLTSGLILSAMVGYLNSAQPIYVDLYNLGTRFPLYFALVSSSIGMASFLNSRLVMRFGMRLLVTWSLVAIIVLTIIAVVVAVPMGGHPPFALLVGYLMTAFFCVGILFGNMNSLAMEPLGHIAGIGSAVIGALSTLLSVGIGTIIGRSYNGTILPLTLSIGILAFIALLVVLWTEGGKIKMMN